MKCLNRRNLICSTVCTFMYDCYIKLGVLTHKHVYLIAEKAPLSQLPQRHLGKFTKVLERYDSIFVEKLPCKNVVDNLI